MGSGSVIIGLVRIFSACMVTLVCPAAVFAGDLDLQELINEALKNSPEIHAAGSKASASGFRVPQAASLPDPMFMIGYQNEGYNRYNYGDSPDAKWMYSVSQTFPYPGKLPLKGEMAAKENESLSASSRAVRLRTVSRIKELYYDLFLAYKNIDLIRDRSALFSRVEEAALARYSSGTGMQQDVLMAQTEKYMLLEKEEMLKQKIQSLEGMLNTTLGRDVNAPLGRPVEPPYAPYPRTMDELIALSHENSPEIKARQMMAASAEAKVKMAQKEYYPDFTIAANLEKRGRPFEDMWSVTTTFNIPLFYKTKQRQGVREAEASLAEARSELQSVRLMLSSNVRDNYSMLRSTERLMALYRDGLIPKTHQDFQAALSSYTTGKSDALTVVSRLKSIIDYEIAYWGQLAERGKAIARLGGLTGITDSATGEKVK
jgi:outer membrane protein TolC